MSEAKNVLAGLLRDGTLQTSIDQKGSEQPENSTLHRKYDTIISKQLGLKFMMNMIAVWVAGQEPGQRPSSKAKKSQKEAMEGVLSLVAIQMGWGATNGIVVN